MFTKTVIVPNAVEGLVKTVIRKEKPVVKRVAKKPVVKKVVKKAEAKPKTRTVRDVATELFKPLDKRMAYKDYLKMLVEQARFAKVVSEMLDKKALDEIKLIERQGKKVSAWSYALVKIQMGLVGFTGLPVLDMKTRKQWQEEGFAVKTEEVCKVHGIMYKQVGDVGKEFNRATKYDLFHHTQVVKV